MASEKRTRGFTGFVLKPISVTMREAISAAIKPSTVLYPYERIKIPSIARCHHVIDWNKCIGCQLCSIVCPNECIYMETVKAPKEDYKGPSRSVVDELKGIIKRPAVDVGHCLFCGDCQEYCPTNAYQFTDNYELADYARPELYYSAEELRLKEGGMHQEKLVNRISENPHLEVDKCIGCRRCERECPTRCIKMVEGPMERKGKPILIPTFHPAEEFKPEYKDEISETYSQCIGCSTCVSACPPKCLYMKEIPLVENAFYHIQPEEQEARIIETAK